MKMNRNSYRMGTAISSLLAIIVGTTAFIRIVTATESAAQAPRSSQSHTEEKLTFDVASVRQNKSGGAADGGDEPRSNVPLGPGNVYSPTGGLFFVRNYTLLSYITFAYKMTDGQLAAFRDRVPEWVIHDRFDIQARTDKRDATKDQLRLMLRSLLAERFNLSVHYETRQVSVYALLMVKPGTMGPKFQKHPAHFDCPTTLPPTASASTPAPPETVDNGFPTTCGGIVGLPASAPHRYNIGGRSITMGLLTNSLAGWGSLDRPVVDKTGLQGTYDFTLEFSPESPGGSSASSDLATDFDGPTFQEALKRQLGLKIESQKGEVQVLVLDHIDHLIGN
ncbi:MAG: TIGR03435 family protein [Edaphobacter sp.]